MSTTLIAARSYTLAEIDGMAEAIRYLNARPYGRVYEYEPTYSNMVQEQLRTYMMGGVGLDELEARVEVVKVERKAKAEAWAKARGVDVPWHARKRPTHIRGEWAEEAEQAHNAELQDRLKRFDEARDGFPPSGRNA